ncbi:hypothetical protein [Sphingomonas sp.]|uniref:hypothetical protein n=1 Tax=Sphingomonas sp. TaxID=28214 RepID=UPI00286D9236|nr:hypothetical protein [Sphingomonas sp.]
MSRFDGKISAAEDAPIDAAELLAALRSQARAGRRDRTQAIARYLSGSADWRDAKLSLGGAFAEEPHGPQAGGESGE